MMLPAAFGAVHAPHLTLPNLEEIIGESPILQKMMKTNYKLMSGSKYRPMQCSNLRILLEEVLEEILQHGTDPDRLFEAGTSFMNKSQESPLFVLGNTTYLTHLKRTVVARKRFKLAVKFSSATQENLDFYDESKVVAIIGMSGRFPGSDSTEELWTNMMERKEFHKRVRMPELEILLFLLMIMD